MNDATRCKRGRRNGSFIVEVSIAVVIASVAMVCVAQLVTVTARQHHFADQRWLASIELGNLMEDLVSRPFAQITNDPPPTIELSDVGQQTLPDAKLRLEILPEDGSDDVRRITIRLEWQNQARQRIKPVQLVAWKYRQSESQP